MPWRRRGRGYTTSRGGHIRRTGQYEALRKKGMGKRKAARIANKRK